MKKNIYIYISRISIYMIRERLTRFARSPIIAMQRYAILSRLGCNGSLSLTRPSSVTLTSALLYIYTCISHLRMRGTVARYVSVHNLTQNEPNRAGTALAGELYSLARFGFVMARFGCVHTVHANRTEPRQHGFKE